MLLWWQQNMEHDLANAHTARGGDCQNNEEEQAQGQDTSSSCTLSHRTCGDSDGENA